MAGALGGALTQPIVVFLLERMSWREAFPIFGASGLVWAAAWLWWFRDDPPEHDRGSGGEVAIPEPEAARAVPWRALPRHRGMVTLCLMYFCAIYGWYFYLTWLPTYLLRARGFDLRAVGWRAAAPLVAIALGGWLSDLLSRRLGARAGRRAPGLVGLPLAALAILGAVATPDPHVSAWLFAAAAGLAALGVAPAWAVCLEIGGRHAGVVTGAMNTFGNLGGVMSPIVVGWCLDAWGSWNASLVSVALLYGVAAACWLGVDPLEPLPEGA